MLLGPFRRRFSLCRMMTSDCTRNRLSEAKSPYLLQHASNPVHWYPWGEDAFKAAKDSNKLIFLSVGYSTCHWCHVMERESFENDEVASIMNEHFVNVKVDREERPDVDKVYMKFVQASMGGGGWPMSVFLTPTLKPVFGGTYFPPEDSPYSHRPGFKTVLRLISKQWRDKKDQLLEAGDKIIEVLKKQDCTIVGDCVPDADATIKRCFSQLLKRYDPRMGGFSKAPKFPQPVKFNFLFCMYALYKDSVDRDEAQQALKMALHTLDMMALGGINDHVSKGFARYSTDDKWHVPHFEKMLYDQAQLCVSYSHAYQATKNSKYADVVRDIVDYVSRDLRHTRGCFYSAEDADSFPTEGADRKREGAFCVWTKEEITRILDSCDNISCRLPDGVKASEIFSVYFNVEDEGNVDIGQDPHGELRNQNILTKIGTDDAEILGKFKLTEDELRICVEDCKKVLHEERHIKRPRPHLDDKVITAWNGLMISGLCAATNALQDERCSRMAVESALFLRENMVGGADGKTLFRSAYRRPPNGEMELFEPPISGFADDYAYVIRAAIDLYEVTFDPVWLEWAVELQQKQDELFWDTLSDRGYYTSPADDPNIVLRLKEDQDGAEPACNSVSILNLLRLAAFLDRPEYKKRAGQVMMGFSETLAQLPMALPEMVTGLMSYWNTPVQIIISGDINKCDRTRAMVRLVQSSLLPHKILILADGKNLENSIVYKNLKVLKDIGLSEHEVGRAYVCRDSSCSQPVNSAEELAKLLKVNNYSGNTK